MYNINCIEVDLSQTCTQIDIKTEASDQSDQINQSVSIWPVVDKYISKGLKSSKSFPTLVPQKTKTRLFHSSHLKQHTLE